MQNLTSTLLPEIRTKKSITLPSGNALFNWIDAKDIGEVVSKVILEFDHYKNSPYDVTGLENKNFKEVSELLNKTLGQEITYKSINPIAFYFKKRKDGMPSPFAIVMTLLHTLPRFQEAPRISDAFQEITGKQPSSLKAFISREASVFKGSAE